MNSYVCPRCGTRGPILLRADQVCKNCQSANAWARFGGSNQVLVINPKAEAAKESTPLSESPPAGGSGITWSLLILSLGFTASVIVLLVYFFKQPPSTISPEQVLNRFHSLAANAAILGALAVLTSTGIFYYSRLKGYDRRAFVGIVGPIVICLAVGVSVAAFFCWSKTEKVQVPAPGKAASTNFLIRRLQSVTAVIQTFDRRANRYRSAKGAGVVIGAKSGKTWILTVPYSNDSWRNLPRAEALWVNFSDDRTFPGRVRWVAGPPVNLAIVEVEADGLPSEVEVHPIAAGVVPAERVLVASSLFDPGWTLEQGTILKRQGMRTNLGWICLVDVDLAPQQENVGSGMYDLSGRLLGLKAGFDQHTGTARFVTISSEIAHGINAARESGSFEVLDKLAPGGNEP